MGLHSFHHSRNCKFSKISTLRGSRSQCPPSKDHESYSTRLLQSITPQNNHAIKKHQNSSTPSSFFTPFSPSPEASRTHSSAAPRRPRRIEDYQKTSSAGATPSLRSSANSALARTCKLNGFMLCMYRCMYASYVHVTRMFQGCDVRKQCIPKSITAPKRDMHRHSGARREAVRLGEEILSHYRAVLHGPLRLTPDLLFCLPCKFTPL